jgi:hypothetical protein
MWRRRSLDFLLFTLSPWEKSLYANMIRRKPRIQEYEKVGPWIFLYISFLKRKNSKKPTWYRENQE